MNTWIRPISLGVVCAALVACSAFPSLPSMPQGTGPSSSGDLAASARVTGAGFVDEAAAQRAGFVALNAKKDQGLVFYRNPAAIDDGLVAAATQPEGLIYGHARGQSALLGLMYLAPTGKGPEIAGATWTRLDTFLANQRTIVTGLPDAVSTSLSSYDAVVVWMFDHPEGQYSTTVDRAALEAALRYAAGASVGLVTTDPSPVTQPRTVGTPQASMPNASGIQNLRSTVGTVRSISGSTLVLDIGNGTREFTIAQRATVTKWGATTESATLNDVQVGNRVSVGTPSAQRPDIAATIVILGQS